MNNDLKEKLQVRLSSMTREDLQSFTVELFVQYNNVVESIIGTCCQSSLDDTYLDTVESLSKYTTVSDLLPDT
jgi:hypothetical protein